MGRDVFDKPALFLNDVEVMGNILARGGIGASQGQGKVFYVDPNDPDALDTWDGQDPEAPFKTLQAAIDACVDDRGDVIIRMAGSETVTTSVLFNKLGITVLSQPSLGYSGRDVGERVMTYCSATDEPAAIVSKSCVISGMGFSGEYVGAGGHVFQIAGAGGFNGGFVHVHRCRFPHWGGASGATDQHEKFVYLPGAANLCYIEECSFDGLFVGIPDVGAIEADGLLYDSSVVNCMFRNCRNAISHKSGATPVNSWYHGNVLLQSTKLLDNNGCTATGLISDNWSQAATDTGTYDDTVAALKALGLTFAGNHYAE